MDAVKYTKEFNRMCRSYVFCSDGCPLKRRCILFRGQNTDSETIEELVAIVEKWSKEHPLVTNGDKVMEIIKDAGVPVTARGFGFDPLNTVHIAVSEDWWDAEYKGEEK